MFDNVITYDEMQNLINNKYELLITKDSIISILNESINDNNLGIIISIICILLAIFIVLFIAKERSRTINLITLIIVFTFLSGYIYSLNREKNNIKYSLENECWSIETDVVIKKISNKRRKSRRKYYIRTKQYGKIKTSYFMYGKIEKNKDVYILCVQDKNGRKYPINHEVWPADKTLLVESMTDIKYDKK